MNYELEKVEISEELRQRVEYRLSSTNGTFWWPGFDPELETLFCQYSLSRYSKINITYPFVGCLGLLLFSFADYQVAPSAIYELLLVRCIAFLAVGISIWLLSKQKMKTEIVESFHIHQLAICLCCIVVHLILMRVGQIVAEYGNYHYQTGSMLLMFLVATVLRVDFRYAVPTIIVIYLSQVIFAQTISQLPASALLEHIAMFSMVAIFSCMANVSMEHEIRKTFLQSLLIQSEKKELEAAQDKLRQLSITDSLTGLMNRRGFEDRISSLWPSTIREKQLISAIMVDIDFFKQYNDREGHPAGDAAIKVVAETLSRHSKRPNDLAARVGGEEFLVVLPQTDHTQCRLVAESIRESVWLHAIEHPASPFDSRMTVSIGIATCAPAPGDTFSNVIVEADAQLYMAKAAGRNQVVGYLGNQPSVSSTIPSQLICNDRPELPAMRRQ